MKTHTLTLSELAVSLLLSAINAALQEDKGATEMLMLSQLKTLLEDTLSTV